MLSGTYYVLATIGGKCAMLQYCYLTVLLKSIYINL